MIRPGLTRITALLRDIPITWRAVHVAGTNGKGSICAYLSALFHKTNTRCGRFTSPHLIDRWDCITIDENLISEHIFREVEAAVLARNEKHSIGATEFEVLTATAFEIFSREQVELAVVECGLGGRLDATNVIERPLVTVISRIGLDHQGLLGNTLKEIASEKAGIMKMGTACVVDETSDPEALQELRRVAADQGVSFASLKSDTAPDDVTRIAAHHGVPKSQVMNMACAVTAFAAARREMGLKEDIEVNDCLHHIRDKRLPGRFQSVDISRLVHSTQMATLDGAHNTQAWAGLLEAVSDLRSKSSDRKLTWVIAASEGKDTGEMFRDLPSIDHVILTEFGPVDGMPWVKAMQASKIMPGRTSDANTSTVIQPDPREAIQEGARVAQASNTKLVIAGSLYLVSDVLRLLREVGDCE